MPKVTDILGDRVWISIHVSQFQSEDPDAYNNSPQGLAGFLR